MPRTPKPLPDKLSDLIDLAVTDAQKIGKRPGYKVDMGVWHAPQMIRGKKLCCVCMAGAVMANSLGIKKTLNVAPYETGEKTKLEAIDEVRHGQIGNALVILGFFREAFVNDHVGVLIQREYNTNTGRAPWRVYRKAAAILREAGL